MAWCPVCCTSVPNELLPSNNASRETLAEASKVHKPTCAFILTDGWRDYDVYEDAKPVAEIAERLGVREARLRRAIQRGVIPTSTQTITEVRQRQAVRMQDVLAYLTCGTKENS